MNKEIKNIGLFITIILGITSIIASNGTNHDDTNYTRITSPSFVGHSINDIAETIIDGSPLLVAVGSDGSWTSPNGTDWQYSSGPAIDNIITWGLGTFFALSGSTILKSTDGKNWVSIPLGNSGLANHVSIITGGRILVGGYSINPTHQYWFPTVWISSDGITWDQHLLATTTADIQVYSGSYQGDHIVVGGSRRSLGSSIAHPVFWYSEDGGENWKTGTGPFSNHNGKILQIIKGSNNVFYAESHSPSNDLLWKSTDGKSWVIAQDDEVANSGERFMITDQAISGQSNTTGLVGSRNGSPAIWSYTRSYNTWSTINLSDMFGSELPTKLTGVGISANIAPKGYVYTGTYTENGVSSGAIWIHKD